MNNFFFMEDEPEVVPEVQQVELQKSFWPFPIVNEVRSAESQSLINKGYTYGT